jgi:hypothetical protein
LNSRKGREDNHTRVETVQAVQEPGGETRGWGWNVAAAPSLTRYGTSYTKSTNAFNSEKSSISLYPYIAPISCTASNVFAFDILSSLKGLSFISNHHRRKEGTFCALEVAGIEPKQPAPEEQDIPAFAN